MKTKITFLRSVILLITSTIYSKLGSPKSHPNLVQTLLIFSKKLMATYHFLGFSRTISKNMDLVHITITKPIRMTPTISKSDKCQR
jgi:hypothetical protein